MNYHSREYIENEFKLLSGRTMTCIEVANELKHLKLSDKTIWSHLYNYKHDIIIKKNQRNLRNYLPKPNIEYEHSTLNDYCNFYAFNKKIDHNRFLLYLIDNDVLDKIIINEYITEDFTVRNQPTLFQKGISAKDIRNNYINKYVVVFFFFNDPINND